MLTVGFCYFLFLLIDIRLHVKKAKRAVKEKENRMRIFEEQLAQTQVINTAKIILVNIEFLINLCFNYAGTFSKLIGVHANFTQQHQFADSAAELLVGPHSIGATQLLFHDWASWGVSLS